jgi:hypothetical protein
MSNNIKKPVTDTTTNVNTTAGLIYDLRAVLVIIYVSPSKKPIVQVVYVG